MAAHHINISHSQSRRSIPQMPNGDAHQWRHNTSKPAIPNLDARFHKCPMETHISGSTPHQNQSRRSIPQVPTGDAHQWHHWQHTTSKPSIPHLDARFHKHPLETRRQWQHTTSSPAISHLDTRFHKRPLETHISGMTAHQNQPFPI